MEGQQGESLCWIAVAMSVQRHFQATPTLRQCELIGKLPPAGRAGAKVNPGSCCTAAPGGGGRVPAICDYTGRLDLALGASPGVDHLNAVQGRMAFTEVQSEIDKGIPVCAFISFGRNNGHFILISGYNVANGIEYLYVKDPLHRDGIHPYD